MPILIGALGPKGRAVAERHDGVFATTTRGTRARRLRLGRLPLLGHRAEPGEDLASERVLAAAGPGGALAYHATYELYGREAVPGLPGGDEWLAVIDERPLDERHLGVHVGHCIHLNEADEAAWAATGGTLLPRRR